MTKTVLISINTSWNIVNFRTSLIASLRAHGYRVLSAAPSDAYSDRLRTMVDAHIDLPMDNAGTSLLRDAMLFYRYFSILLREKPSVMLTYTIKPNIYGSIAAWLCGVPVIANVSGLGTAFLHKNLRMKFAQQLYRIGLAFSSRVFFQNAEDQAFFVDNRLVNAVKTRVLSGSGVNLTYFSPKYNVERAAGDAPHFVLIARLLLDKGIAEYVEAARQVKERYPKAQFHLLGPMGIANKTAVTADQLNRWVWEGNVQYLGETDDVRTVMAAHDCIVLPSYREGMSRVLLEAAAMGKPLIASDVPGCRPIVEHGKNGYLCQSHSADDLAQQMLQFVAASQEMRAAMGRYSREKAEREFNEALVIDAYYAEIAQLTS